jgi:hypothetical protein
MEDVLTSNVFSFFKYADRSLFLKRFLYDLGFKVTDDAAQAATFCFWPTYENNTEPDLVIKAGSYYILFEAKYHSGFGIQTEKTEAQLVRELQGGVFEADAYKLQFALVAITADYVYRDTILSEIPGEYLQYVKWTNWQKVSALIEQVLNETKEIKDNERLFAEDLNGLLDKKNLRGYRGPGVLFDSIPNLLEREVIFFEAQTAKFRGDFIGFIESLSTVPAMKAYSNIFFSNKDSKIFKSLNAEKGLECINENLFYKKGDQH